MVLGPFMVFTFIYSMIMNTLFLYKCRSDPTENDSVEGLRPNARGPGLVTFGVRPYDYSVAVEFLIFSFSYYFTKCLLFHLKYCVGSKQSLLSLILSLALLTKLFPVKFAA